MERSLWWRDVYGFNMGSIEKASVREAVQEKVGWAEVFVIVPELGEREGRGDL